MTDLAADLRLPEPLDAPGWLSDARAAARARLALAERPTTASEEWRYSRLDRLAVFGSTAAPPPRVESMSTPSWLEEVSAGADWAARALVVDGYVVAAEVRPDLAERGVRLGPARHGEPAGGAWDRPGVDVFAELNAWAAPDPLVLVVPDGVVVDDPVLIRSHVGIGAVSLPRTVVVVGRDAEVGVLAWWDGDVADATVLARTDVDVAPAGRVRMSTAQVLGPGTDLIATVGLAVGQQAAAAVAHAALGGRTARTRFDCELSGRGASGDIAALYLGHGDQMHDLRTFQRHDAPDTTSDLVFKGALADRSHAVYTGLIRVGEDARGTNAEQSNRIITLGDDAWAESVPNLEIHNNDVRCAHASAVGPIDEDQRFYLESRGVAPAVAERLVVAGFFEEVLACFPPAAAERLRATIAARLGGAA